MGKRFISIWFCSLKTDFMIRRQPGLKSAPFVLVAPDHGRMLIKAANNLALQEGAYAGQVLADARAVIPGLQYFDDEPGQSEKLLTALAEWFIRFTPAVAVDLPDGLLLDASGCTHLWGGELPYLEDISKRLNNFGYSARMAIADTIGAAWAVSRFGKGFAIIPHSAHTNALLPLPPAALRLEATIIEPLEKLGLLQVGQFIQMPRTALRRRFGNALLKRLDQALGNEAEFIQPHHTPEPFHERLPCLEPIISATGIRIAIERLLTALCSRLQQEEKGLRIALLKCYRHDGKIIQLQIGTTRPSHNGRHLLRLMEEKIDSLEVEPGIELFTMDAPITEPLSRVQEKMFGEQEGLDDKNLGELLDRITGKFGEGNIHRYMPAQHYWPERSYQEVAELNRKVESLWKLDRPRPVHLFTHPVLIDVAAPVPDYPPMHFRYKGALHKIVKADGPERIEPEWWLQEGMHRDYYVVEDEAGRRYWLFRLGHYDVERSYQWFLHGFFA